MVVCPKCRKPYTGRPALSRVDNKTDICPDCGMREAIESIPGMNDRKRIDPAERTRRLVQSTGNRWAMENFNATHGKDYGEELYHTDRLCSIATSWNVPCWKEGRGRR